MYKLAYRSNWTGTNVKDYTFFFKEMLIDFYINWDVKLQFQIGQKDLVSMFFFNMTNCLCKVISLKLIYRISGMTNFTSVECPFEN